MKRRFRLRKIWMRFGDTLADRLLPVRPMGVEIVISTGVPVEIRVPLIARQAQSLLVVFDACCPRGGVRRQQRALKSLVPALDTLAANRNGDRNFRQGRWRDRLRSSFAGRTLGT